MQDDSNLTIPDCCEIRPSPIEGVGVFAKRLIKANEKIVYYTGIEMSYQEFKERYGNDWRFTYRRMPWQNQLVSKDAKNLINYVNDGVHGQAEPHSNVFLKARWLIAREDIPEGTELTLDYGKKYWAGQAKK